MCFCSYFQGDFTPLHIASKYSEAAVVKFLLEIGADTNVRTARKFFGLVVVFSLYHQLILERLYGFGVCKYPSCHGHLCEFFQDVSF